MGLIRKEDIHESLLNSLNNPNILINGYFKNPINQRGLQSYSVESKYTIDRWKANGNAKIDLVNNGIKITPLSNGVSWDGIKQYVEDFKSLSNKKITLSLKVNAINGTWATYVQINDIENHGSLEFNETGIHSVTMDIGEMKDKEKLSVIIDNNRSTFTPIEIEWVKLEIGDHHTEFVPRPYGEELALCQRYYECSVKHSRGLIGSELFRLNFDVQYKQTKRIIPTLKVYGLNNEEKTVVGKIGSEMNFPINVYFNNNDGFGGIDVIDKKEQSFVVGEVFEMYGWEADAEIY